jgi:hypothetical protein
MVKFLFVLHFMHGVLVFFVLPTVFILLRFQHPFMTETMLFKEYIIYILVWLVTVLMFIFNEKRRIK